MIEKTAEDSMLGAREKGICYFWFLGLSPTKISKNIFINIQVGKVTNVSSESSVTSLVVEPRILF